MTEPLHDPTVAGYIEAVPSTKDDANQAKPATALFDNLTFAKWFKRGVWVVLALIVIGIATCTQRSVKAKKAEAELVKPMPAPEIATAPEPPKKWFKKTTKPKPQKAEKQEDGFTGNGLKPTESAKPKSTLPRLDTEPITRESLKKYRRTTKRRKERPLRLKMSEKPEGQEREPEPEREQPIRSN